MSVIVMLLPMQKLKELRSMPKLRALKFGQSWNFGDHEKQTLKKLMPLVRFEGLICADERDLLPANGIWDVKAKQLEYFKKISEYQFHEMPDKIMYHVTYFLEIRDLAKFGQVSKRMRAIAQDRIESSRTLGYSLHYMDFGF